MKLKFEWDAAKVKGNWKKHGVSFELATTVFRDPFASDHLDDRADYGEQRLVIIGMAEDKVLLSVVYTEREDCVRPNPHGELLKMCKMTTYSRTDKRLRPMTAEEVERAAWSILTRSRLRKLT